MFRRNKQRIRHRRHPEPWPLLDYEGLDFDGDPTFCAARAVTPRSKHTDLLCWLRRCEGASDVAMVTVTIGKQTWLGARYRQRSGDRIYCIGFLPAKKAQRDHVCFTRGSDSRDWYVAGYWPPQKGRKQSAMAPAPSLAHYHPFGPSFILMAWDIPGQPENKIDTYERKPYQRISMTVTPAVTMPVAA
jgi:hypothetical protein